MRPALVRFKPMNPETWMISGENSIQSISKYDLRDVNNNFVKPDYTNILGESWKAIVTLWELISNLCLHKHYKAYIVY